MLLEVARSGWAEHGRSYFTHETTKGPATACTFLRLSVVNSALCLFTEGKTIGNEIQGENPENR